MVKVREKLIGKPFEFAKNSFCSCRSPLKGSSTSSGSSGKLSDSDDSTPPGKILYELNGVSLEIPLSASDCDIRKFPRKDDVVMFDISQVFSSKF